MVNETVNSYEGSQVGTVGRISAEPGVPNVIPGIVNLSLEIKNKISMILIIENLLNNSHLDLPLEILMDRRIISEE